MKTFLKPRSLYRSFALLLVACCFVAVAGCGPDSNVAPVSGTVSFEGNKVAEGTVTFYPTSGGRPATGTIQPDGTFTLSTFDPKDGAMIGDHKVAIEARQLPKAPPAPTSLEEEIAGGSPVPVGKVTIKWLVPEKYASAQTSELTATVNSGQNQIDFTLP
ncbi:hypothetical protein NG895_26435 [Aeoliella sp. ICT_H6.2]|uniref:Carboxypeptidase regulatory-like domain-containing protein n=1 Tax=Aeoliella straminimaris TaxID=2954799 RepID=A0A9X2JJC6_9BACT|nr:hypothetical protein [Aeoliella straminimaris]MCO6047457.1 hypothetical protein [Aeoliella straminimaris]